MSSEPAGMGGEIIKVRLDDGEGRRWTWQDGRRRGAADFPLDGLSPGDELVVEMRWRAGRWEVARVVDAPRTAAPAAPAPPSRPRRVPPSTARRHCPPTAATPGEVWVVWMPIDARSAADHDVVRHGKRRPCVVVEVDHQTSSARVLPVHGTRTSARRQGMGRRIRSWREAGLEKPSIVSPEEHVIDLTDLKLRVGTLAPQDQRRLAIA
ncbi:MAG: type II toxin-antitoxin system PemK/MazF family toxin [Actinomycetota bacterium]|nr:type II toxin-antitoxin system PemK/MazF family toxin [Actinomycetota bacterium]